MLRNGFSKRFDIGMRLKTNSYTVSGLAPGVDYLFELCLKRADFIIVINRAVYTTRYQGFEVGVGIETDWVTLLAVTLVLSTIILLCLALAAIRWYRFQSWRSLTLRRGPRSSCKDRDTSSQKEMITSPSDHSSVAVLGVGTGDGGGAGSAGVSLLSPNTAAAAATITKDHLAPLPLAAEKTATAGATATAAASGSSLHLPAAASAATKILSPSSLSIRSEGEGGIMNSGDKRRLVENEMKSPVDELQSNMAYDDKN